tara:strand:- start:322 stop:1221 length:900 start_codon:yes stop_codon:yes gene_type:complete
MRKVKMKSLVIGMGIGQLYKSILTAEGHTVVTVDQDPAKGADYTDVAVAITEHVFFDTAHVCTPNFTHVAVCDQVAPFSRIVFVEKPGAATANEWISLIERHPRTCITMVKNNQWRTDFFSLAHSAKKSSVIRLNWINKNRVPNAGSWFTNKELSYGGVSRDLLPHLLSFVSAFDVDFSNATVTHKHSEQRWTLDTLTDTDYGTVNKLGIYDVDDRAELTLTNNDKTYILVADWRDNVEDNRSLTFEMKDSSRRYELGLCPEDAYLNMILTCVKNLNNTVFWQQQFKHDVWIHDMMELL